MQLKRRNVDGPTRATHAEAQADLDRARQCASRSELKHVLGRVKVMKVRGASQTAFQKVRMKIRGAAQPAAKAKAKVKQCSKPRCRNNAASPRAKYCIGCFRDNARCTGARTGGNSSAKGVIGNRGGKGVMGNSGNRSAKGLMGNRGNTSSRQKKKITALVIIHIELAAEARIKKVCRRCWRNLWAQQLMQQQGPTVVAIMSPECQEEEQ